MRSLMTAAAMSIVSPASAEEAQPGFTAALMSVVIRTAEPQRELTFYRDGLGMSLSMERDLGAKHEYILSFGGDLRQAGILLVGETPASAGNRLEGQGGTRFILRISNLAALAARLDRSGIAHSPIREVGQGFSVMGVSDPDHNDIELVQGNVTK